MRQIIIGILMFFVLVPASAQNARDYIRMGNKAYRQSQYDKAETMYLKSVSKVPSFEGYYNLGNVYVMQRKDSTAFENYKKADSIGTNDAVRKSLNYHNMGNIWYAQGIAATRSQEGNAADAFQNAVNFYKSSLRCNPSDNETRYNLAMAQYQLKKSQNNKGGQNDNGKDDKDQQKQKQQNQDQQKKDQQKDNKDQQQNKSNSEKKDEMSKQAAEQLLNSAQQDEKSVQRKLNENKDNRRKTLEKDW